MEKATHSTAPPASSRGATASETDLTGGTLGDFQILRRLGAGAMGQVYLAEQVSLKRKVALKIMKAELASNPVSLQRFKAEAEAVARITHPNIVQIYAIGEQDGLHFMALEFVDGKNLREYLAKKGSPELPVTLSIIRQIAAALQRAGEEGIVHRDIKPDNILLGRKGEVKVADFGLVRSFGPVQPLNLTQSGVTLGTPLYMSPEQVQGKELDPRSDLYSFGVTCYHLLSGRPPFRGETPFDVAFQHVQAEPDPLADLRPDLPPVLCALVHKLLAKSPADRCQSGREVLKELGRLREALGANAGGDADAARAVSSSLPVPVNPSLEIGTSSVVTTLPATPAIIPNGTPALAAITPFVPTKPSLRLRRAIGFMLSLIAATVGGGLLALMLTAWQGSTADAVKEPVPPRSTPPALVSDHERELVEQFNRFLTPGGDRDRLRQGTLACTDLVLYRLDAADSARALNFFDLLIDGNREKVPAYTLLGLLGKAILLSRENQVKESQRLFQEFRQVYERQPQPLKPELQAKAMTALVRNRKNGAGPAADDDFWKPTRLGTRRWPGVKN